jgi:hypothetical protein
MKLALGGEPMVAPRAEPCAAAAKERAINSAIEHLRAAAQELETAGLASNAAQVRDQLSGLKARVNRPSELKRQHPERPIQVPKSDQVGRPNQLVLRCKFIELSAAVAEEFEAAAELVTRHDGGKGPAPGPTVYKNADRVALKLAKAGKARIVGSPEMCTHADVPTSVLNGGEFPVLVPQGNKVVTVQWREFGTRCTAMPHWLDTGKLQLNMSPELTVIDRKHSVVSHGLTVPGLTTRRANLQVEMNLEARLLLEAFRNEPHCGLAHQFTDVKALAPGQRCQLARLHEPRPAWRLVAAREDELRVGELRACGVDFPRMMLLEIGECGRIAVAEGPQQVFGLMFELIEGRTYGKSATGHDEPPSLAPVSAGNRRKRRFA